MTRPLSPERWAFDLTHLLNAWFGPDRFPIDIPLVARDYTAQRFPDDPIISVKGDDLPGFDGALFKAPVGRRGWGIIYNNRISSKGRINFTLAHEFGHFLMHRLAYPDGFCCGEQDVVRWDSEYGQVEHQANVFAANFLMPLDDFRRQISATDKVNLDMISHCADRYRVSLIAATLRWLSYTQRRAVLVVSRDGFILWARSSEAALKTGAFFRTSEGPIEIPATSLPNRQDLLVDGRATIDHGPGVWFREPAREMTVYAEQYDFAISLLVLDDARPFALFDAEDEADVFDKMMPPNVRREW
ncbi:ImmA/IrrE family metallo-endopeptidase [Agrobacterium cavarae]|uniref:ImmA/IrrE family metallo-endopeptidase n=1 Tax=Agrobacterium cavarae TaxID=2528239 RepID=UPI00289B241C|nr:ImmA/IrrE family metallo-endopeptidase [Agrobacterium cavarae]